jgi:hypothetical protein
MKERTQRIRNTSISPAMMSYTSALTRRMQAMGWKPSDSFYVHAHRAHDALHAMRMLAHYNVCGLVGAGRQSEPPGTAGKPPSE